MRSCPRAIAVKWAREVPPEFHARFSARRRSYHYLLLNRPERPGLLAGRVGWCHRPLDLESMRLAAQHLVGEHDFSAFRSAQCQAKSPVKKLERIAIEADDALFTFEFVASAFLHHMVRNIIGALVLVGHGAQAAGMGRGDPGRTRPRPRRAHVHARWLVSERHRV